MKKTSQIRLFLFLLLTLVISTSFLGNLQAQEEREDNPRTWKYFRIFARSGDDSIFIKLQDDLLIDPKLESYVITVNIQDPQPLNQYIVIGDETSPDALRYAWSQLSPTVQEGLINWVGTNKENLNRAKLNYASVFIDVVRRIKVKELIAPPQKEREIKNTTAYISPYFQAFGGPALGIPIKRGFGFSFISGTPYSGPMESEMVGAAFHLLGASVGVSTRIKELTLDRASNETNAVITPENGVSLANYNNIFAPELGLEVNYVIPFGNFFQVGYYTTLTAKQEDRPVKVQNALYPLQDSVFMPNLVVEGSYTNFEFRYPFRTFGSTTAKVYFAKYLGEWHAGFLGREMRLAGSLFDIRIDNCWGGLRNYQVLVEAFIADIAEGFGQTSFAFGPSVRLGTTSSGGFGALTVLANMRFKMGDYFDEK